MYSIIHVNSPHYSCKQQVAQKPLWLMQTVMVKGVMDFHGNRDFHKLHESSFIHEKQSWALTQHRGYLRLTIHENSQGHY
jgi:hypothetical protein